MWPRSTKPRLIVIFSVSPVFGRSSCTLFDIAFTILLDGKWMGERFASRPQRQGADGGLTCRESHKTRVWVTSKPAAFRGTPPIARVQPETGSASERRAVQELGTAVIAGARAQTARLR